MLIATIAAFLFALQIIPGTGGGTRGRDGNAHYKESRFEDATNAYTDGLGAYDREREPDLVYYGLQNNLGSALYRQENFDGAAAAFNQAAEQAQSESDYARASYNAGNTAFQRQDLEAALAHYKNALLADPSNTDARYNFEFVKRQQQQNQEQNQENQDQNEENNEENQDDQQQDQQEQNQQEQSQQEQQNQEQQEQQEQQPDAHQGELTREQAERILQALEEDEQQLLREIQKIEGRPRRVAKDW